MKISTEIRQAIQNAIDEHGTQELFARKCSINRSCLSKYINGQIQVIESENWTKILPFIQKHLPQGLAPIKAENLMKNMIEMEEISRQVRCQRYEAGKGVYQVRLYKGDDSTMIDLHHESGIYVEVTIPANLAGSKKRGAIGDLLDEICRIFVQRLPSLPEESSE